MTRHRKTIGKCVICGNPIYKRSGQAKYTCSHRCSVKYADNCKAKLRKRKKYREYQKKYQKTYRKSKNARR